MISYYPCCQGNRGSSDCQIAKVHKCIHTYLMLWVLCLDTFMCVCMYIYVCMSTRVCVCICMYVHMCVCMYSTAQFKLDT